MIKWFLIVVMFIHGLIHLMGGINELGIAKIEGLSGKTLIPLSNAFKTALGISWFIPVILFLMAAVGLATNRTWWKGFAIAAAIVSQILVIIWWPDAKWGTVPNILILMSAFFV